MSERLKLAIIGAGPKAAAICARAAAIRSAAPQVELPKLEVFEAFEVGANWIGPYGYSDGEVTLCTSLSDYDLVTDAGSPSIVDATAFKTALETFGWTGEPYPKHRAFGEYLRTVFTRAQAMLGENVLFERYKVIGLQRSGDSFAIDMETSTGRVTKPGYAGVVVTSPGPPQAAEYWVDPAARPFVTNTRDYWKSSFETPPANWQKMVVLGGGGASAAVALSAIERFRTLQESRADDPGLWVYFISTRPTLLSRGIGLFEQKLLRDPERWSELTSVQRDEMRRRMISGVIFESEIRKLEQYAIDTLRVEYMSGRPTSVGFDASTGTVVVYYLDQAGKSHQIERVGLVVDARGFDAAWFLELLDEGTREWTKAALKREQRRLGDFLDDQLRVRAPGPLESGPNLHAPMLSGFSQPPGLGSLLQLGAMAQRILDVYLLKT